MSFPAGITRRIVNFGTPFGMADGDDYSMTTTFTPDRSLVWAATGDPGVAQSKTVTASVSSAGAIELPVTDQAGWRDSAGARSVAGGAQAFLYLVDIEFRDQDGVLIDKLDQFSMPLLTGDGSPVDLDLQIQYSGPPGVSISIPDTWSAAVTAAQTAATAAAASAALAVLTVTGTKAAAYTAGANQIVPVDASTATVPITLPTAPADKTRVLIKKIDSSTNVVTVARGGTADVFNKPGGSTSLTLTLPNQAVLVQYTASTGIWTVFSDDLPLSQLDLRYLSAAAGTGKYVSTGTTVVHTGPAAPAGLVSGTPYIWNKTDSSTGLLLDIRTGTAA